MSEKKDEDKPKAAQPFVQEDQIDRIEDYINEELGKVHLYGENMTIEKILTDPFYEPTKKSANFIAMMEKAGRGDELKESKESEEKPKESDGSGKDESANPKGEDKTSEGNVTQISNALEVAAEQVASIASENDESVKSEAKEEVIATAEEVSGMQYVKVVPSLGKGNFKIETIAHLHFLSGQGTGENVSFDFTKDSTFEKNAFYLINSFIPASKPVTEDMENTETVPLSAHELPLMPMLNQKYALEKLQTVHAAILNDSNPKTMNYHKWEGARMQTFKRPNGETLMPIQNRYIYPENFRRNALRFKVWEYFHPTQEQLENEFGPDLNRRFMGTLRVDKLDMKRTSRIYETINYPRIAFGRPSRERKITSGFLLAPPNPVSAHIYKTSRANGMRHLMIANVDHQLRMPMRMSPELVSGFSTVNPTSASTFAQDYILYLTSSASGDLRPDLDKLNTPDSSVEVSALAALAYLCVVDHNLIEEVDIAHLLIAVLAPFYDLLDATIDDKLVEGLISIATKLASDTSDVKLPVMIKTIITRKFESTSTRPIQAQLENILRSVFKLKGLQLRRVDVHGPIKGLKDDTYSPFLPNLVGGQDLSELLEGRFEVSAAQFMGWQEGIISNVRDTGILNSFVRILDLSRRDGKIGQVFNTSPSHAGTYGRTALAVFTSTLHSAADLSLYPASIIGHRTFEPNGITELNPFGALAFLMIGVTTPYLSGDNADGLIDKFNNQYVDEELYKYSPKSSISLPSNERFRLSMILSIMNEVVEHFRSVRGSDGTNKLLLDKYPKKVKECVIQIISIYYSLTGDENKLLDLLFEDRDRYLGPRSILKYPMLPSVLRDIDNGRLGDESFDMIGAQGRLLGASHITLAGDVDTARAYPGDPANVNADVNGEIISAKMTRGYVINQFSSFMRPYDRATFSQARKIDEAIARRVDKAYIAIDTMQHRVDLFNNNDSVTSVYAMSEVPTPDQCIDFTTLLNINYYDNLQEYTVRQVARLVQNLKAMPELVDINRNVKYVCVPLEETTYKIVERPELAYDEMDTENVVINVKRSSFTSDNKYTFSTEIPVYVSVTEKMHLLRVEEEKVTLDPRAFNLSFTPILYIHMDNIARAIVGMELLREKSTDRLKDAMLRKEDVNLYKHGLVRIRTGGGVVLSEMKPVTSRVKEDATIKEEFSTRLRVIA